MSKTQAVKVETNKIQTNKAQTHLVTFLNPQNNLRIKILKKKPLIDLYFNTDEMNTLRNCKQRLRNMLA